MSGSWTSGGKKPMRSGTRNDAEDEFVSPNVDRHGVKKGSLYCELYDWADINSICGIPHLARYAGVTRVVFACIFLAFVGLTIHDTYKLLADYYSWPVKTEFSLKFSPVSFPSVTICNFNPIRHSHVNQTSQSFRDFMMYAKDELLDPMGGGMESEHYNDKYQYLGATDSFAEFDRQKPRPVTDRQSGDGGGGLPPPPGGGQWPDYEEMVEWDLDYEDSQYDPSLENYTDSVSALAQIFKYMYTQEPPNVRRSIGHQPQDTILYCIFNGRPCSSRNFKWIITPDYGNCFTFNYARNESQNSYKVRKAGPQAGLSVMLYVDQGEYMPFTQSAGFRVAIHDFHTMAFPFEAGMSVSPGEETSVAMTLQLLSRQSEPYNNCTKGIKFMKDTGYKYSTLACQDECMQREILKKCNCSSPMLNVIMKGQRTCREKEEDCVIKIRQSFTDSADYNDKCPCNSPCKETAYNYDISAAYWPSEGYLPSLMSLLGSLDGPNANILDDIHSAYSEYNSSSESSSSSGTGGGDGGGTGGGMMPPNIIGSNFALLNVYFKELNFNNITETPQYNRDKLMADLGGVLGLYTGITAFGIIEVLHLLLLAAKWCLGCDRNKPDAAALSLQQHNKVQSIHQHAPHHRHSTTTGGMPIKTRS